MSQLQAKLPTDTWVNVTWDEYLLAISDPSYEKARGYYYDGRMRLEMSALGNPHSRDHFIVIAAIALFAGVRDIDFDGHDNCTYRKRDCAEAQPDVSFYLGANAEIVPWEATIIDLDTYPPPDLVIEVAYSSLADDKGEKRLLYESLGVREYWIIDVQNAQIIAFEIQNRGSRRIYQSQVLPGLDMALLEEALRRSRQMNHGKVSAWLLSQFQG
ncbi:Uma2 family endonuclease [Coleofasciculus sp. FACHB-542]|uniref:Uma2 family endonuclease n=1 Tax=Coleofasciculus sp. FACHB-542 TaxID=2692787 RepID=UPI001689243B|nr:Uma2 family endonuclease [Coleofasciculus sp. FACHB-542]MBD2083404.1 Uma2 family endonuclease [Coleofasciculus sp. FACHB-542]